MATSLEKKAALWVLVTTVGITAVTALSGYWEGVAQDAEASSLDAVAEANQANLQAIYAATGQPAPTPTPSSSTATDWGKLLFAGKNFGVAGRQLPARTDIKGWAAVRNYYGQLANWDRVAILFLTLAIALFSAAVSIGAAYFRRLVFFGKASLVLGALVGVFPVVQVVVGF